MDPDANLAEQREILARLAGRATVDAVGDGIGFDDLDRLAELVEALDGWLARGGFAPRAWGMAGR